jgi:integrase
MNTGLRRGELFDLTWRDVDLEGEQVTVRAASAKSGKTRHVPLNQTALGTLEARQKDDSKPDDLVFQSPKTGGRLNNVKNSWQDLVDRAKLIDFRFHDTRHDFASRLVMAGTDLNIVRELLGHSTMEMTLRYAHLAPEHKASAVALLDNPKVGTLADTDTEVKK